MRQNNQVEPNLGTGATGEARSAAAEETEARAARTDIESRMAVGPSMEAVVERRNMRKALARVKANKGAPGIDGMTFENLAPHLKEHWPTIRVQLLDGSYQPQPVRRVEIPKASGGKRPLGIPTVLDRFIQQALMQVLQADWTGHSPSELRLSAGALPASRGEGPGVHCVRLRRCGGHRPGEVLRPGQPRHPDGVGGQAGNDKRILKLIRGFLTAGVLADGLVSPIEEGTPQGGPLSPLLSNLMLDVLDKELEKRGHRFVRYADDCNIYVRSQRAGERVMESIEQFLTKRLKLRLTQAKSAVAKPSARKFLGFSFTGRRTAAPDRAAGHRPLQSKGPELTRRTCGKSLSQVAKELSCYLVGWRAYFGFCETPSVLRDLDQWVRRRLRAIAWKQWKRGRTRYKRLRRLGVGRDLAANTAGSSHGPWRLSASPALHIALSKAFFATSLRLATLAPKHAV